MLEFRARNRKRGVSTLVAHNTYMGSRMAPGEGKQTMQERARAINPGGDVTSTRFALKARGG